MDIPKEITVDSRVGDNRMAVETDRPIALRDVITRGIPEMGETGMKESAGTIKETGITSSIDPIMEMAIAPMYVATVTREMETREDRTAAEMCAATATREDNTMAQMHAVTDLGTMVIPADRIGELSPGNNNGAMTAEFLQARAVIMVAAMLVNHRTGAIAVTLATGAEATTAVPGTTTGVVLTVRVTGQDLPSARWGVHNRNAMRSPSARQRHAATPARVAAADSNKAAAAAAGTGIISNNILYRCSKAPIRGLFC